MPPALSANAWLPDLRYITYRFITELYHCFIYLTSVAATDRINKVFVRISRMLEISECSLVVNNKRRLFM